VRILIAEDEPVSRHLLEATLSEWGYEVTSVEDGPQALAALRRPDGPKLAVLDWEMPGVSGPEVCRHLRAEPTPEPPYVLLLTVRDETSDLVEGLRSGANDYVVKPFRRDELAARLHVAGRLLDLQHQLAQRVAELEQALAQVRRLRGLIPICAWCKKVRNDQNYWQQVEDYVTEHSDARFNHSMCPECFAKQMAELNAERGERGA